MPGVRNRLRSRDLSPVRLLKPLTDSAEEANKGLSLIMLKQILYLQDGDAALNGQYEAAPAQQLCCRIPEDQ